MSRLVLTFAVLPVLLSCAAASPLRMSPLAEALRFGSSEAAEQAVTSPPPPSRSPFARDAFALSEPELERLLAHPLALDPKARVGVVRVTERYGVEEGIPLDAAPRILVEALDAAGLSAGVTEVSTDWPADRGLPGLRELSARYRARYLLLYRHRFVEKLRPNAWAAGYATLVGAFVLPGTTYQAEGVLEATLFDALTGSVVFTAHERASAEGVATPLHVPVAVALAQRTLLAQSAPKLADAVVLAWRRLTARATELSALP